MRLVSPPLYLDQFPVGSKGGLVTEVLLYKLYYK